jgi:hypothetical protein
MKQKHLTTIAAMFVAAATSLSAAQNMATVVTIHGLARYSTGNNVWLPLSEGKDLPAGTVIQTASESWVDISLDGSGASQNYISKTEVIHRFVYGAGSPGETQQNVIRLRENTVLAIDRLSFENTGGDTVCDIGLDLRAGRVFGNVKKLSAASKYEVKLPNGVAGIRGTIYDFNASGSLAVVTGGIVASYFDNGGGLETKVVSGGQLLDMITGTIKNISGGELDSYLNEAKNIAPPTGTGPTPPVNPEPQCPTTPHSGGGVNTTGPTITPPNNGGDSDIS